MTGQRQAPSAHMSSGPDLAGWPARERTSCSASASPGRGARPPRSASLTFSPRRGRLAGSAEARPRPNPAVAGQARAAGPLPAPDGHAGQPCPGSSCRGHDRPDRPRPRSRGRGTTATRTSSETARSSVMSSPACQARSACDPGCPRSGAGRAGGRSAGPYRLETGELRRRGGGGELLHPRRRGTGLRCGPGTVPSLRARAGR
jgi:hypothetical protein